MTGDDYIRAYCLSSLERFARHFFKAMYKKKFIVSNHHTQIISALQDVAEGKCRKLIINMPPRYGKSEIAVKMFISYGLAVNPSSKFVHLSYSDDLARDNSETVRSLILHDEFRRIFPYIELSQSSRSKKKWTTTDGGGVYATSTGGQITGFGAGATDELDEEIGNITTQRFAGAIIIDDPIKPEDALSDARREKINDRFETTIRNRVNSRNTPIVIIMQRTHKHDLTGYLLEKEPGEWRVLSLPALITDEAGEHALWEFKHTLPELYKLREINRFVFETQYMQNPMPMEGLLYVDDRWKEYDSIPVTNTAIRRNCTDTADKGSDWLCSICYVETELGNFITDVTFTQSPMEETESEVARMLHANLTQQADIEGNNGGRGFARNVESKLRILGNTTCRVRDFAQTANKETRILTGSAAVQNMTYFPRGWRQRWPQFYGQLSGYMRSGRNAHDDAADCLTMTVERRGESRYQSYEGEVQGDTITQVHLNLNGRAWYCVAILKDGVTYITDGGVYDGQKLSGEVHVEADASTMAKAYALREEADAHLRKDTPNKQGFMDQWSEAVREFKFKAGLGELYDNLITYDRVSTYEAMYLLCRVAERVARLKINN